MDGHADAQHTRVIETGGPLKAHGVKRRVAIPDVHPLAIDVLVEVLQETNRRIQGKCHIQHVRPCASRRGCVGVCVFQREIHRNHCDAPHRLKFLIFIFVQRSV